MSKPNDQGGREPEHDCSGEEASRKLRAHGWKHTSRRSNHCCPCPKDCSWAKGASRRPHVHKSKPTSKRTWLGCRISPRGRNPPGSGNARHLRETLSLWPEGVDHGWSTMFTLSLDGGWTRVLLMDYFTVWARSAACKKHAQCLSKQCGQLKNQG